MYRKIVLAAAAAALFAAPALAATTFYVSQDAKTHKCTVSDKQPDGKVSMMIGTVGYATQAAAQAALKAAKDCGA